MKEIVAAKPLFFFYLGSETTPPCKEFVNHLVISKALRISSCQLKVLRENSLATSNPRQIHSRIARDPEKEKKDEKKEKKKW